MSTKAWRWTKRITLGVIAFIGLASLATAFHRTVAITRALEREEAPRG